MSDKPSNAEPKVPSGGTTVSDLAGIGTAVALLIEKLASAIGTMYKPRAILAEGKAAVDVKTYEITQLAQARQQAEASSLNGSVDLEIRAVERLKRIETLRQRNIDTTTTRAIAILQQRDGHEEPGTVSTDWLRKFLDCVQDISDTEIQGLWSEILARKATAARRSVSIMTLDSLRLLEANQARLFERIARAYVAFHNCFPFTWDGHRRGSNNGMDYSLLGPSDTFDDFDALVELGFISIHNEGPLADKTVAIWPFPRFTIRASRQKRSTSSYQKIRLTFRGEELLRVVLNLDRQLESLNLGSIGRDETHAYVFMSQAHQAELLHDWFGYLAEQGINIEIGPKHSGLTGKYFQVLRWSDNALVPHEDYSEDLFTSQPPEIRALRSAVQGQ